MKKKLEMCLGRGQRVVESKCISLKIFQICAFNVPLKVTVKLQCFNQCAIGQSIFLIYRFFITYKISYLKTERQYIYTIQMIYSKLKIAAYLLNIYVIHIKN